MARQDPIQTPAERSPNLPLSGPTIPYEYAASEPLEALLAEEARRAPSLPIVLLSAASGLGMALFGFYAAYGAAHLSLELSAGVATLLLCLGIGVPGALLSWATGSRAALPNIGLSCGLVVLALSFLASCAILGALTATILIAARL